MTTSTIAETPVRIRKGGIAKRHGITERLAMTWIGQAIRDGVAAKRGRFIFARLSDWDAWVMAGAGRAHRRLAGGTP